MKEGQDDNLAEDGEELESGGVEVKVQGQRASDGVERGAAEMQETHGKQPTNPRNARVPDQADP
jgi:hypothetical protein